VDRDRRVHATELAREAVRAAERLGGERREVIDVLGLTVTEQRLEQRSAGTLV
jgi:hypothetical protein